MSQEPKILVTLGPSSLDAAIIRSMDECGVFVFRINMSHTPIELLEPMIEKIQAATNTPICIDSEGAQIRTRRLQNGSADLKPGSSVTLHFNDQPGDAHNLSFSPTGAAAGFRKGDLIDIDFHGAQLQVVDVNETVGRAEVIKGGSIGENKAVALDREHGLPPMTEKDLAAVPRAAEMGLGYYALSFAGSAVDVDSFRAHAGEGAYIIAKIESRRGLRNLAEIADAADAILIDRGDLSREIPIAAIPFAQRHIVDEVRRHDKPVFVATNLLETMVERSEPNRAEVNDIVSTLEMGASGLVLAAETAIGAYPLAAVRMSRRLIDCYGAWSSAGSFDAFLEDFIDGSEP